MSALMAAGSFYFSTPTNTGRRAAWFFAGCTAISLFSPYLRRRQERHSVQRVVFDSEVIEVRSPSGRVESIRWADLAEIEIVTTDEGPWAEDAYWMLSNHDRSSGCAVANGAEGFSLLLERLQRLPGFDNAQVISAMGSTSKRRFPIWRRT